MLNNSEGNKLKTKTNILILLFILLFTSASISFASVPDENQGDCDSLEVLKLYSLFSEYHKNHDFGSALPYGWQVLECNPTRFAKWIYYKIEDCLWGLHDSTEVDAAVKQSIEDTVVAFYDMALTYYPEEKAYFQKRKAFVMETWLELDCEQVIPEYEKALEYNPDLSFYYSDRLGELYVKCMADDNDYKLKAINLYSDWAVKEPDNPKPPQILNQLVEDIGKLLDIHKQTWLADKDNLEKAWQYASYCIRAEDWARAIEPLEFLTQKSPDTINYWNQLATAYQKEDRLQDAENALLKLIEIDPDNKDHYFNLGIVYSDMGKFSKARQQFKKASDIGNGWGLPIFYEGYLYEQAAGKCSDDWQKKLIYQLAIDTYRRAKNMDSSVTQAQSRINALSGVIPTQEDWFFHKYKSGDKIAVGKDCASWIGRSITVP